MDQKPSRGLQEASGRPNNVLYFCFRHPVEDKLAAIAEYKEIKINV
jgi:hypothetical protein